MLLKKESRPWDHIGSWVNISMVEFRKVRQAYLWWYWPRPCSWSHDRSISESFKSTAALWILSLTLSSKNKKWWCSSKSNMAHCSRVVKSATIKTKFPEILWFNRNMPGNLRAGQIDNGKINWTTIRHRYRTVCISQMVVFVENDCFWGPRTSFWPEFHF